MKRPIEGETSEGATSTIGRRALTLQSMLSWDIRLQVRYGFYTVYAVVTLFYLLALGTLPADLTIPALVLVVVTDTAVLGFYFVGALVLIEKREGVLDALVVTPLGVRGYIVSKAISLTALATLSSTVVVAVVHSTGVNFALLLAGVTLTASLFVLVGVAAVSQFRTINRYFFSAVLYGTVLYAPIAGYLGIFETPLYYLLPIQPALVLVEGAFSEPRLATTGYALAYLSLGNVVAYVLARSQFQHHIVQGGGNRRTNSTHGLNRLTSWVNERGGSITGMALADARNWVRDPILLLAATGPLALGIFARFVLPVADRQYVPGIDLSAYFPVALAFLVAFPPYIYGFVVGFFVLEDREQGTLSALVASPLTRSGYLRYRGLSAYLLSAIGVVLSVALFGLVDIPLLAIVGIALVAAVAGPAVTFLFASLARNSIEGLAINKLLGLVVVLPALVILVLPEPVEYVAGLDPLYWPMKAAVVSAKDGVGLAVVGYLALGLLSLGFVTWNFARRFDGKT